MTLPVFPNPISLNQVNVELGLAGTTLISLNQANVRTLAGVPTPLSTISMNNLHGKTNRVSVVYNITSNVIGTYGININSVPGYSSGRTDVIFNISAGIYMTGNTALYITSGSVGDTVTINNNGYILGDGGDGGSAGASGGNGRTAIAFQFSPVSLTVNNAAGAYIAGGGGGGAGSASSGGGGGAGGGSGGFAGSASGGAGGGIGASGANGTFNAGYYGGGGGGRVLPGARTSASQLGLGGSSGGGGGGQAFGPPLNGGYGGGPNEAGQTGSSAFAGGGGGWGAAGGSASGGAGGAAGNAIVRPTGAYILNNSGNIYGAVV